MQRNHATPVRHVVVLGYPGVTLLDISGPMQVFATAEAAGGRAYRVTLASARGGPLRTDVGLEFDSRSITELVDGPEDTVLVAGGDGVFDAMMDEALLAWLRERSVTARRIGSTCMGAFLLAAAGLLDGRRATTHWRWADTLRQRFPTVAVHSDAIYLEDGGIWSSAGVSAGIDLALAMVQQDIGRAATLEVARRLVVHLQRAGGQSQFSSALELQTADRTGAFDRLHGWIMENLHTDLSLDRLAQVYGRSTRTFLRHYKVATGHTPAKAVEMLRVEAARVLLEQGANHLGSVARRCGFEHVETMRRSFLRCLGVGPGAYRDRFGTPHRRAMPAALTNDPVPYDPAAL